MALVIGGLYEHYKEGNPYRVLGVVRHSETLEELIHYECLYNNPDGKFWVRPRAMFESNVTIDGITRPRFAYQGRVA